MAEPVVVACASCGARNRVDPLRTDARPICGRCGAALPIVGAGRPVDVTDLTFAERVLGVPGPVLLDAWAPWCGPCRALAPVLERLAADKAGRLTVARLDTDANPATASRYGIRSIPTLLLFRGGELVDQAVGALPRADLDRWLARHGL